MRPTSAGATAAHPTTSAVASVTRSSPAYAARTWLLLASSDEKALGQLARPSLLGGWQWPQLPLRQRNRHRRGTPFRRTRVPYLVRQPGPSGSRWSGRPCRRLLKMPARHRGGGGSPRLRALPGWDFDRETEPYWSWQVRCQRRHSMGSARPRKCVQQQTTLPQRSRYRAPQLQCRSPYE